MLDVKIEPTTADDTKEHVMVGIPNMNWVASSLASRMIALERASHDPASKYRFSFVWVQGAKPADYARNIIAGVFLKSNATRLWFMDSDTMPPKEFTRLLAIDADIVSGITPTWGNQNSGELPQPNFTVARYDEKEKGFFTSTCYETGTEAVDAVGTAMMIIRRKVLEDPALHLSPAYITFDGDLACLDPGEPPAIFREVRAPNGRMTMTEDYDLCYRAKKLGYSIVVDHGIKCGHWKQIDVLQVIEYLRTRVDLSQPWSRRGEPQVEQPTTIDA